MIFRIQYSALISCRITYLAAQVVTSSDTSTLPNKINCYIGTVRIYTMIAIIVAVHYQIKLIVIGTVRMYTMIIIIVAD